MTNRTLSLLNIFFVFLLITLGGLVHNTGSSLACPDWPLCYGHVFPDMVGGILIEHSHRLLASFVGFLTIALVVLGFKNYKKNKSDIRLKKIFVVSCFALFFVIFQGILGGITVIYRLPTIVSTFHLGTSMFFLLTLIYLHHLICVCETSEISNYEKKIKKLEWKLPHSSLVLLGVFFVFFQLLLGAFIRHSGAGVACGLGFKHAITCLDQSTWINGFFPTTLTSQVHMLHRFFGILIFIIVNYVLIKLIKSIRYHDFFQAKLLRKFIILGFLMMSLQILLGILTVSTNIGILFTTAHLFTAAVILALSLKIYLVVKTTESYSLDFNAHSFLSDLFIMMKLKLCLLVLGTVVVGMLIESGSINFFTALFTTIFTAFLAWGAAILNCYIERDVDSLMERTKDRPLPSKRFSKNIALTIGISLTMIGFVCLWILVNPLTAVLGGLASLIYLFAYTPLKTKSSIFLFIGAIVGAIPPVMGVVSASGQLNYSAIILFIFLFIWQIPHFLALSIYYQKDYKNAEIKIIPLQIGDNLSINLIALFTFILVLASLMPSYFNLNDKVYLYWVLLLGSALFILSLFGKFTDNKLSWAYKYFIGTIIYLPLCLLGMLFFK